MIFDRAFLERLVIERLHACSFDELRVIERVLQGIEHGREQYGPLDLTRDVRNWRREGAMELRDYLFYAAAHEVALDAFEREQRTERFRAEVEDRLDEMREIETERSIAMASVRTEDLRLCICGHPESVHAASGCLIAHCRCAVCEVAA